MSASNTATALRASLSVPGSSSRKLEKARDLEVDELVLDLEDAVAPAAKEEARERVAVAIERGGWRARRVAVRVNAAGSPWCHLDLLLLAGLASGPDSVVVPKVEGGGDLAFVERLLAGARARGGAAPLRMQALIETAAGLARVAEIAAASRQLESLVLGYADLAASLGRAPRTAAEPESWLAAQDAVLLAARSNGLRAVDGPHLGVEPDKHFRRAARHARDLGFDGKWTIHPAQVAPLQEIFTPGADEVARARAVVAALEAAEADGGRGAVTHEGGMIDEAVAAAARRLLARADAEEAG
jgi:citrate lyase subunit beta / citryl-CoA lyase